MRKYWWITVLALMLVCLSGQAVAAEEQPVKVTIEGKQVEFAAAPVIDSGNTLVPFRGIFERIGLTVAWDDSEKKVTGTRRGTKVELAIGSRMAVVNGKIKELEVPPKLINGYTYVPLRLVGEASDYRVDWKADTRTVVLEPTIASIILDTLNDPSVKAESMNERSVDRDWTGKGRLIMEQSPLYEGDLRNGEPNGQGKFMVNEKLYYEGQWRDSRFDGEGKLYADRGFRYEGNFLEGLKHGKGKEYSENGTLFYDGEFVRNVRKGKGTLYDPDGNRLYEGQVDDDIFTGQGTLYYKNGSIQYQGGFANDKFDGIGKLFTSDGKLIYEGAFSQGNLASSFASYMTGKLAKAHEWKSFRTKRFHVYYYTDEATIQTKAEKFDDIYDSIYRIYGHKPEEEKGEDLVPVYVVSPDDLKNVFGLEDERFAGMWYDTVMLINSKALSANNTLAVYQIFQHELVHAMTIGSDGYQVENMPGWFVEGAATFHENDPPYSVEENDREQLMKDMVRTNDLLPWESLSGRSDTWGSDNLLNGYAQSWSIWSYLAKTYGEDKLNQIFYGEGTFNDLLAKVTRKPINEVEQDWRDYVQGLTR